MVSTVKSRPNYYEMLGIAPGAAGDAIAQAFARATSVFRPHAFGSITEICVAFETLRDPVRRRAYDASLGLAPKRTIPPASRPASAHFMQRPAVAAPPPSAPGPEPEPQARPQSGPIQDSAADKPSRPLNFPLAGAPVELSLADRHLDAGIRPIEWKRTGIAVGGLAGAAVLFGALAGWWSGSDAAQPEQAIRAEPARQAPEEKLPTIAELWTEPARPVVEEPAFQPRRAASARPHAERPARPQQQLAASEAERQLIQPPQDLADAPAADRLAPETPVPAVVANM
ncbi:MAG TPA: hypothetical protein VIJ81_08700, partial [Sphingomicrobium sp.]